jgi:hypothetical protein
MKKVTTKDFIERARIKHNNKYNYLLVNYQHGKIKIKIICPIHGEFEQTPNNHINGKGCSRCCTNTKLTNEEFILKAKLIHGDKYDYSRLNYTGIKNKIKIICQKHGEFEQTPDNHINAKQGCPNCSNNIKLTNEEFILRAKLIHGDKYDYSLVNYGNNGKEKNKIICKIHGIFEQQPTKHLCGNGCQKCSGHFMDRDYFIEKSNIKHNNKYDYSLVNYINNSTKVEVICPKHGIFKQQPNNHMNGDGCPICKESKGERKIRIYLIENNINFINQYRFKDCRNILPLPFDFYLPEYNICIEFQGRQHYVPIKIWGGEKGLLDIKKRDKTKMEYCQNNNIPLIIIKYNENIIKKLDNTLIEIKTERPVF